MRGRVMMIFCVNLLGEIDGTDCDSESVNENNKTKQFLAAFQMLH